MDQKFEQVTSSCVPLDLENVDTDQIIPARFLKAIDKKGFGGHLFADWRYDKPGVINRDFALNDPRYSGSILLARKNFGCGSSREHAAWALVDYGFRVIISSYFADIFKNNALNNGLLPVQVDEGFLSRLFAAVSVNPAALLTIDLLNQKVVMNETEESVPFDINPYKKDGLINGHTDIDYALALSHEISKYEMAHSE